MMPSRRVSWWRKTLAIAEKSFQDHLHFRSTFGIRVAGTAVHIVVLYALMSAVYANAREIGGLNFPEIVAYILVSQALAALFAHFWIAQRFKSGDVAEDLVLPLDFQLNQMSQAAGRIIFNLLVVTIPLMATTVASSHGQFLPSVPRAAAFAISAALGLAIMVNLRFLMAVLAFWTVNEWGMQMCVSVASDFLSGSVFPLSFFPDWLQTISAAAPFQYGLYVPVMVFLGKLSGAALIQALATQLFWAVALFATGRLALRAAARRILIFGG